MKRHMILFALFFLLTACAFLPIKPTPSVTPLRPTESPTTLIRPTNSPAMPDALRTLTAPQTSTLSLPTLAPAPTGTITAASADMTLRYHWENGSVAPPYHYEYDIRVSPTTDAQIVFSPDYAGKNTPVWTEKFAITRQQLSDLTAMIDKKQVMTKQWPPSREPQVGGGTESLEVTTRGKTVKIPSQLEMADAAVLRDLYAAIRALVPKTIWDNLMARRDAYMKAEQEK